MGYIYIFTNPSFPQYVKIGYATDVKQRLDRHRDRRYPADILHRRRCKLGGNRHAAGIGASGVSVLPLDIHIGRQAHYFYLLLPQFCSVWSLFAYFGKFAVDMRGMHSLVTERAAR